MNARPFDHLYTLQRSPLALAPVIYQFYNHRETTEQDVLLSYLILPLVLYPPTQDFLHKAKSTSSLRTMCEKRERLAGLVERVQQMKSLTNDCLLILSAEGCIGFDQRLGVTLHDENRAENANPRIMKAAERLATIFGTEHIVTIYRMLGLKSL
ncbi:MULTISPECIES: three component ABC system middle component [Pseudomonas]|jgi:hypothetical protein|uniref:three component ABC system middle component n=1 Tax=Pseudomonas TaxID=286 RepID=UPI00066B20BF|nr:MULTISPECIES: three component ABC system middle component [Pseudomonas]PYB92548.1 hypothetical protein DMX01_06755 [Pseudomonas fulva]PYC17161.1 hypothetical protein DMX00_03380 [Pseudomonas fulva]CAH0650154.1 hypothetical protein PSNVIR_04445 [Pseudomonas sp. Nvir]